MSKKCIGYNDITKQFIYIDDETGITYQQNETGYSKNTDEFWVNYIKSCDEKDRYISDLEHKNEVLERALKLACEEFAIGGACVYCDHMAEECKDIKCPNNFRHYYKNLIEQAEKELKGEDDGKENN